MNVCVFEWVYVLYVREGVCECARVYVNVSVRVFEWVYVREGVWCKICHNLRIMNCVCYWALTTAITEHLVIGIAERHTEYMVINQLCARCT